jgi:hypothetical protein
MGAMSENNIRTGIYYRMRKGTYVAPVFSVKRFRLFGDPVMIFPFRAPMKGNNDNITILV